MFLIKFFNFLNGYVILSLKGFYIERFINICTKRGIWLWDIQRTNRANTTVCVRVRDFRKIRPVAKKTFTSVRIKNKCGLPIILYRYRKRYMLFLGVIMFVIFMGVMSQFVWSIEIDGAEQVASEQILLAAKDAGIKEGAYKGNLDDIQKMRDIILSRVDGLTWAWVYIQGTKIVIEVREKILPPMVIDKNMPCDVIAMRDGLIKKITVKEGRTSLKVGDAVLVGDVVIAGTLENEKSGQRLVHALGIVEASTWYEETGDYKLYNETREPTGEQKTYYTLNIFSKKIPLFFKQRISYEEYDTIDKKHELKIGINNYLGVGVEQVSYIEVNAIREDMPIESVLERAKNQMEEKIGKNLLTGAILENKNLTYKQIDNDTVRITLVMEFTEKIGTEKRIEQ